MHQLDFAVLHKYPEHPHGITVEVTLRSQGLEFRTPAKIDTGAAFCIFSREIAEALEIDVETGHYQQMATATGLFDTYGHELSYSVLGINFDGTLFFSVDRNFSRNVLGRRGWLDKLRVGIVEYDHHLLVAEYDS